jgi:hypothetical protein
MKSAECAQNKKSWDRSLMSMYRIGVDVAFQHIRTFPTYGPHKKFNTKTKVP